MASNPSTLRISFGDPDSEPDVTYLRIEEMVDRFLRNRVDRGVAAIDPDVLLINRTLAAGGAIRRRLCDQPEECTNLAFSWLWTLFKPMLVRAYLFAYPLL